ncbi:MAG TPA: glycosyltransferase family 1 protein [Methylomirabilota bacterium]|nr:glycosyltransferase family 1 protein [Methylomirabilota bacterium]
MRLAYDLRYATDHFPGIGSHAWALGSALAERGRFDEIAFLWDPRATNSRFPVESLRAHPRVRWHELSVPALSWQTAHATGSWLERSGVDAFFSPFWLNPERTRVPCVLTLHDVLALLPKGGLSTPRRWVFGWALGRAVRAAAVVTSSRFSREEILRHTSIPAERLHMVPLGLASPAAGGRRPSRAPEPPFALVVGTNRVHKGHDTLAAVWRRFAGQPPLALVGAGANAPSRFSLGELSASGLAVTALGPVAPDKLEWLYAHATLVLVPSRYEGFGLPLLEAALRGAAVIASDIPALRETGDAVARFVPVGDVAAWERAIRELAADEGERQRMAAAGQQRAAEYDYARCAERVEAILEGVALGPTAVTA